MATPSIDIMSDVCDAVGQWQERFISEVGLDKFRRAALWAMSETVKASSIGVTAAIGRTYQNPTPWMMKAMGYTRALAKGRDAVEAELYVRPSQSIVMKYAMGSGPQVRRPGDVGLARDAIYVPYWRNLHLTQGISQNTYGNLPGGVAARLAREAAGTKGKRRVTGRWGVYKGELDIGGSRVAGYIARPFRGEAPIGKNGRSIIVNLGRPRMLLGAIQQATYKPVMQDPYDEAVRDAVARIPDIMAEQLEENIAYRDANRPMRRLGT